MKSLVAGSASLPQDVEPINENDLENLSVSDDQDDREENKNQDHLPDDMLYKTP